MKFSVFQHEVCSHIKKSFYWIIKDKRHFMQLRITLQIAYTLIAEALSY